MKNVVAAVTQCSGILYTVQIVPSRVDPATLILELFTPDGSGMDYGVFSLIFSAYAGTMGFPPATASTGWVNISTIQLAYAVAQHVWMCPLDYPPNAQPNGFGAWCYSDSTSCMEGPNSCTNSAPCTLDLGSCSSGVAGDLRNVAGSTAFGQYCSSDTPAGGAPNGGGKICYDTLIHCLYGPNNW